MSIAGFLQYGVRYRKARNRVSGTVLNAMRGMTPAILFLVPALAALADDGPQTGYFRESVTPTELLGAEGAAAVASVFAPDESLTWQLYVPPTYDPTKPAGVIVFIGYAHWGGGRKIWNPVLEEKNVIWIGLIDGGDDKPVNERLLRAILAQPLLEQRYAIDHSRYYLFGYSGGAHVAAMLASSKPETFKGAWFYAGALPWEGRTPPKLAAMQANRYVFMAGSKDDDKRLIRRVADSYIKAGIEHTAYITVQNMDRRMPPPSYVEQALDYLDSRN